MCTMFVSNNCFDFGTRKVLMQAFEHNNCHFVLFCRKSCVRKCREYKPSKIPEELAEEEQYPVRLRPTRHRPSFPPALVSSVCFIVINNVSTH